MSTPLRVRKIVRVIPRGTPQGAQKRALSGRLSGNLPATLVDKPAQPRCFAFRRALTHDEITGPLHELEEIILRTAEDYYGYGKGATKTQVDAVVALVGVDLDASDGIWASMPTGAGKSRIGSIFWLVRPVKDEKRTLVLLIAPTDAVGDNAALEKSAEGFSSLNITSEPTCVWNREVAEGILRGEYQTVGLSPEHYNKDKICAWLFQQAQFREQLLVKVIDESQKVWEWGLMKEGKFGGGQWAAKKTDVAFRPDYGLMAVRNVQLGQKTIFLSATCTPIHRSAVLASSAVAEDRIRIISQDLFRPNIRHLRIPFAHTKISLGDITPLVASRGDPSELPPTIIFSNSRHKTLNVVEALHSAATFPSEVTWDSKLARRFHSVTAARDKKTTIDDFLDDKYRILSGTSGIAVGVNIRRLLLTIQLGEIALEDEDQRKGRTGRIFGQLGLGVTLIEAVSKKRLDDRNKKESKRVRDERPRHPSDYTAAEASLEMTLTEVCHEVANQIYLATGLVPVDREAAEVVAEEARQREVSGRECGCANCDPKGAAYIISKLGELTIANFDQIVSTNGRSIIMGPPGRPSAAPPHDPLAPPTNPKFATTAAERSQLAIDLLSAFKPWFEVRFGLSTQTTLQPSHFFSSTTAATIAKHADELTSVKNLVDLVSEPIAGLWEKCWRVVELWRGDVVEARAKKVRKKAKEKAKEKASKDVEKGKKKAEKDAELKKKQNQKRARDEADDIEHAGHVAEAKRLRKLTKARELLEEQAEADKENQEKASKRKASNDRRTAKGLLGSRTNTLR
ncbi:hypothetical protein P7C70_g3303, partial [Phenoliferia sp. Uapishka_3]